MSKAIKLQVAEPCHEDWTNMSPNEQGRFCLSCSKTVVDFSAMSDKELYDYFKNYTGGACGRLMDDQLDRNLYAEQRSRPGWFRYALGVLMPAFLLTNRAMSQGEVRVKKDTVVCSPKVRAEDLTTMGKILLPPLLPPEPEKKVDSLPPVFVTANVMGRIGKRTTGAVVRVQKITVLQKVTKFVADSLRRNFVVYPNPATPGGTVKIQAGKGTYYIRVFDVNGILLQEEKMKTSLTLSKNIIPGHYTILLTDEKRKKISSQQLIVH